MDHLLEEFFFQLVGPLLVGFLVSCQVANICTLQQHLQAPNFLHIFCYMYCCCCYHCVEHALFE